MRLVIALGGNALLRRSQPLTAENQRQNMRAAAAALARTYDGHQVAIVHGNGPQVGLLALEAEAYDGVPPYPLDMLGAEAQGMIGYVIAQELRNAMPSRRVACLLTQTLVNPDDPAFLAPAKPIGPVYPSSEAASRAARPGWSFTTDGDGSRRVVPSPAPLDILEIAEIGRLVEEGVVTVCCGGGGIPVVRKGGCLAGVEAVIDKDLTAALLAERLQADRLIILTDVDAVYAGWGTPEQRPIERIGPAALRELSLAEGSMRPKANAAAYFVDTTGRSASIGALSDIDAVVNGTAGTLIAG